MWEGEERGLVSGVDLENSNSTRFRVFRKYTDSSGQLLICCTQQAKLLACWLLAAAVSTSIESDDGINSSAAAVVVFPLDSIIEVWTTIMWTQWKKEGKEEIVS